MIYFDNSATTALSPKAREAMCTAMEQFGNPSSLHAVGTQAAACLRECRAALGETLGERFLKDGQLIFTSCGTEANALALLGSARAKTRRTAHTILTTDSEHPAVAENLKLLEKEGFRVVRVPTKGGVLDMSTVREHCNADLFAVSMMMVNNETGALYPIKDVISMAHATNPSCICHCDAVQGYLKVPLSPRAIGADLFTVSAHKIHGPKGVGALYIAPHLLTSRAIVPFLCGGGQEFGLRSGTENVIGIAGFAAAAKEGFASRAADIGKMQSLSARLLAGLSALDVRVNRPPSAAPHIVNFTLPQIKSETMVHFLSDRGIAVSAGSACSSHASHPSASLLAFGLNEKEASSSIRVSFSATNEPCEVDTFLAALQEGISTLVKMKP